MKIKMSERKDENYKLVLSTFCTLETLFQRLNFSKVRCVGCFVNSHDPHYLTNCQWNLRRRRSDERNANSQCRDSDNFVTFLKEKYG